MSLWVQHGHFVFCSGKILALSRVTFVQQFPLQSPAFLAALMPDSFLLPETVLYSVLQLSQRPLGTVGREVTCLQYPLGI